MEETMQADLALRVKTLRLDQEPQSLQTILSETKTMDREERVQVEFAIWLQAHPESENMWGKDSQPWLSFSNHRVDVKVTMGDLTWLIDLPHSYGRGRKNLEDRRDASGASFEVQVRGLHSNSPVRLCPGEISQKSVRNILPKLLGADTPDGIGLLQFYESQEWNKTAAETIAANLEGPLADCMQGVAAAENLPQVLDSLFLFARHFRKYQLKVLEMGQDEHERLSRRMDHDQSVWDEYVATTLEKAVSAHKLYNMRIAHGEGEAMAAAARDANYTLWVTHEVEAAASSCEAASQAVLEVAKAQAAIMCEIFEIFKAEESLQLNLRRLSLMDFASHSMKPVASGASGLSPAMKRSDSWEDLAREEDKTFADGAWEEVYGRRGVSIDKGFLDSKLKGKALDGGSLSEEWEVLEMPDITSDVVKLNLGGVNSSEGSSWSRDVEEEKMSPPVMHKREVSQLEEMDSDWAGGTTKKMKFLHISAQIEEIKAETSEVSKAGTCVLQGREISGPLSFLDLIPTTVSPAGNIHVTKAQEPRPSIPELYPWWGHLDWSLLRKAIDNGDVLQWCSIKIQKMQDRRCSIACMLEVGEFMEDDLSAALIGIFLHRPLYIEFFLGTEPPHRASVVCVTAHQGFTDATQPPTSVQLGLKYYIPHLVHCYFTRLQQEGADSGEKRPDRKHLLDLMKFVVRALSRVGTICCVCQKDLPPAGGPVTHIGLCRGPSACDTVFAAWDSATPRVYHGPASYIRWLVEKYGPRERPNYPEMRKALCSIGLKCRDLTFTEFVSTLALLMGTPDRSLPYTQILSDDRMTVCAPLRPRYAASTYNAQRQPRPPQPVLQGAWKITKPLKPGEDSHREDNTPLPDLGKLRLNGMQEQEPKLEPSCSNHLQSLAMDCMEILERAGPSGPPTGNGAHPSGKREELVERALGYVESSPESLQFDMSIEEPLVPRAMMAWPSMVERPRRPESSNTGALQPAAFGGSQDSDSTIVAQLSSESLQFHMDLADLKMFGD